MRKVIAFEQVSLDGFFVDGKGDMSWAHKRDPEWTEFAGSNASGDAALALRPRDLRDDGELLADAPGPGEHAGRGRRHEQAAEDRVLANAEDRRPGRTRRW